MFIETNPIPVKEAMALLGLLDGPEFRLPMCRLSDANRERLRGVLTQQGLLRA
jgi:4-hydroxy-tetrahydrodipicolinate synthase